MRLSDKLLLESSHAPELLKSDKLTLKEATTAGVRTLLYNYSRCRFVTDEVANSIGTPFSEKGPTVHYLSKALLCTWTQGEADHAVTAGGQIHLQNYRFQAKLGGQPRICEHILKPSAQGFFKRPNFVFVSDKLLQPQPDLDADASMQLLQGAHDFCLRHAWDEKQARLIIPKSNLYVSPVSVLRRLTIASGVREHALNRHGNLSRIIGLALYTGDPA